MKQLIDKIEALEEVVQQLVILVTVIKKQEVVNAKILLPDYKHDFEELKAKLDNSSKPDLSKRLDLISDQIEKISPPKSEVKQFRFLLFPETDQGQYYKIVFGRMIPWGILMITLAGGISLGHSALENQRIKNYNIEAQKYVKAWSYLEANSMDKQLKKKMSFAFKKVNQ